MVRTPRKSFATPFVVTLAACSGSSAPPTVVTPPPMNPPPATAAGDPSAPAPEPASPVKGNPPAPKREPAAYEQRWYVQRSNSKCRATPHVDCPKPEPGK